MLVLTENAFLNDLRANKISRLYFIFGDEKYLIEEYAKKLEKSVLGTDVNSFNYKKLDEFTFDLADIASFIESLPFCSKKKFLKIIDLKLDFFSKSDLKKFNDILKNLPDYVTVVVAQMSEDVNLKSSGWVGIYKFFQKYGVVLKTTRLSRYNLELAIEKWAKKEYVNLDYKTIKKLLDLCPNDLMNIRSEFNKILAYSRKGRNLYENLEKIVFHTREANVFDLNKAIVNNDLESTLKKLDILLLKKEEPVFILNIISSFFLDVYRVKLSGIYNKPIHDLANFFDYKNKEFRLKIAKNYSERMSFKDIKDVIRFTIKTDLMLKTTNLEKRILLEELIVRIFSIRKNTN